jgi:class 3 adenylate cyclase
MNRNDAHFFEQHIVLCLQSFPFAMIRGFFLTGFLVLLASLSHGQDAVGISYTIKDSLPVYMDTGWIMKSGDDPAWSSAALDDRAWVSADPDIRAGSETFNRFEGLAWFRLHFQVDSFWSKAPLALQVEQYGESRIFLDGVLLPRPAGSLDSSHVYMRGNPKLRPYILNLRPGPHVLAVRYSNPGFEKESKRYNVQDVGFGLTIGNAAEFVSGRNEVYILGTIFFIVLVTLFLTLALTHFFHFAYDRSNLSNLLFSLFSLCIAWCALVIYARSIVNDPLADLHLFFWLTPVCALIAVSFSGFMNELFGSRRRFYCMGLLGLAVALTSILWHNLAVKMLAILFIVTSVEGVILIIRAIWLRMQGARIIGGGMLLMVLMVLGIVVADVVNQGIRLSTDTTAGVLVILLCIIAVIVVPVSLSAFLAWNFARINRNLKYQLVQVNSLSEKNLAQEQEKQRLLANRSEELEHEVALRTEELQKQKQKSDDLLHNILPEQVAEELKNEGRYEARLFDQVTVLFTDFVDFTQVSENMSPAALVQEIDVCFQTFDQIIERYGLEKIKTVGDAYIAVAGLPTRNVDHASAVIRAALDIRAFVENRMSSFQGCFTIRLGVHSGPVVAGIVGLKKYAYDIWGDTVNTAARMEQHSEAGKINISSATYQLLGDDFVCTHRGILEAKHKGLLDMYFVEGLRNKDS